MSRIFRSVLATLVVLLAAAAMAQAYPTRPIRLVLAFPPGGATDVIARTIGQPLSQRLGQSVVVDNRPGSNGNIAAELVATRAPRRLYLVARVRQPVRDQSASLCQDAG